MTSATRQALTLSLGLLGCDWDLQRMVEQERCAPFERSELFPNGWCDQPTPESTVPYAPQASPPDPAENQGRDASGQFLQRVPLPLDRALLGRGRYRFQTFCAPCHGMLGDGHSEVAKHMSRRRPPAFSESRIAEAPDGELYAVITHGYGLMPSYAHALEPEDRWAVVAYVRALALSQHVPLDALPPKAREEAARWLR